MRYSLGDHFLLVVNHLFNDEGAQRPNTTHTSGSPVSRGPAYFYESSNNSSIPVPSRLDKTYRSAI